jgi:Zn-dependent alcohol dehydrogenase
VLFLADILPTALEVGILNGRVEPGDTVAIVGAGPIGLAAILTGTTHHFELAQTEEAYDTSPTPPRRTRSRWF